MNLRTTKSEFEKHLTMTEIEIILKYRALTEDGKAHVLYYVDQILDIDKKLQAERMEYVLKRNGLTDTKIADFRK